MPGQFRLWLDARPSGILLGLMSLLSLLLLVGTGIAVLLWRSWDDSWAHTPFLLRLFLEFDLTQENVVAAWFSSMFLLLIALAGIGSFATAPRCGKSWLRFGWLIFSAGFCALSIDELGELHERLHLPTGAVGDAIWYLPVVVAIPVYMLLFGWSQFRQDQGAFACLIIGAGCFASIPFQEDLEIASSVANGSAWQRPVAAMLLEEGSELLGMMFFLFATARYATSNASEAQPRKFEDGAARGPSDLILSGFGLAITALAILAVLVIPGLIKDLPGSGQPQNWFASAFAFCGAVFAAYAIPILPDQISRRKIFVFLTSALMISVICGSNAERLFAVSSFLKWGCVVLFAAALFISFDFDIYSSVLSKFGYFSVLVAILQPNNHNLSAIAFTCAGAATALVAVRLQTAIPEKVDWAASRTPGSPA